MTTENKEVIKKEYVTTYIANDGTRFDDKEECEKYEKSAFCALKANYKRHKKGQIYLDSFLYDCGCDSSADVVVVNTVDEMNSVNSYLLFKVNYNKHIVTEDMLGQDVLIMFNYDGEIWDVTTIEKIVEREREQYLKQIEKIVEGK